MSTFFVDRSALALPLLRQSCNLQDRMATSASIHRIASLLDQGETDEAFSLAHRMRLRLHDGSYGMAYAMLNTLVPDWSSLLDQYDNEETRRSALEQFQLVSFRETLCRESEE
jgi:hypothetical protein